MALQSVATSESVESSLPQMRIPTQADDWLTQLPQAKAARFVTSNRTSRGTNAPASRLYEKGDKGREKGLASYNVGSRRPKQHDSYPIATASDVAPVAQQERPRALETGGVGTKSWLRRMSRVPADQKEILDSSSSHYPPLPGQDRRSGAIPIKLLQAFCARVDAITELGVSTVVDGRQQQVQRQAQEVERLTQTNGDNDQEVTASQWPESPERPPRKQEAPAQQPESSRPSSLSPMNSGHARIPPDSPPSLAQDSRLQQLASPSSQAKSAILGTTQPQAVPLQEPSSATDSSSDDGSEAEIGRTSSQTSSLRRSRPVSKTQAQEDSHPATQTQSQGRDSDPSKAPQRSLGSEQPRSSGDLLVQVKRTPHPGRREHSEPSRSGHKPTSTFIPSTYHENVRGSSVIEADPQSMPQFNVRRLTTSTTNPRREIKAPSTEHKMRTDIDSKDADADFERIAREAREYRRSILKPISKTAASPLRPHHHQASSKTDLTPMAAPAKILNSGSVPGASSRSPMQKRSSDMRLYERFCAAYDDYSGSQKHFDGARRLLSKEYAIKRLHSCLLDDFVFHHTQTYPSYFSECHTSGEEPIPYSEYFDGIAPTHMKKIINAADILPQSVSVTDGPSTQQLPAGVRENEIRKTFPVEQRTYHRGARPNEENEAALIPDDDDEIVNQTAKRHLSQSQHSSVEEWLQNTITNRGESPELGTPNIDRPFDSQDASNQVEPRSKSLKRPMPADIEMSRTQKRSLRSDLVPGSSANGQSNPTHALHRQSPGFPTANSSRIANPPTSSSFALPSLKQHRRRTLPPSFSQVKIKREPDEGPLIPAVTPVNPSASLRRSLGSQPLRVLSKPSAPIRKPPPSSTPLRPSSTPRSTGASGIRPIQRSHAQTERTPFQRFAASWEKLPEESAARERNGSLYEDGDGKKVNPYALIDVTQWRG